MANFIDRLSDQLDLKKEDLKKTLRQDADSNEESLARLVKAHWHALPPVSNEERRPAFAVDGSRAVRHLANGAYLFVAQSLIIGGRDGERQEETDVDIRILPGATPSPFVDRFAELMMHRLEANLARDQVDKMPSGSVLFLDGALYGQLPQLYPVKHDITDTFSETYAKELLNEIVEHILKAYLHLFKRCAERSLWIVSVAKTSRESTHSQVWWKDAFKQRQVKDEQIPQEISDSEAIYRWTSREAGFSTPVLLGQRSFTRGSEAVLLEKVKDAPAIVSFFVRLADYDDALRIDVPANCIERSETIGDIGSGAEILLDQPRDLEHIKQVLGLLAADYGGLEVYNALLYSVDREVRLRQEMMDEVYLSLIQNTLGLEVRLDRSERRFHSR